MKKRLLLSLVAGLGLIAGIGGITCFFAFRPDHTPPVLQQPEDYEDFLPAKTAVPSDEIYVIDRSCMNAGEQIMISSLQGITAQTAPKVFITDETQAIYLNDFLHANPDTTTTVFEDPWEIARLCAKDTKGALLFEYDDTGEKPNPTANMGATVAGIEQWWMVPAGQKDKAAAMGCEIKLDLTERDEDGNYIHTYESIFAQYKDQLNNEFILHQPEQAAGARDYAIAAKAFCMFVREDDAEGIAFRETVFQWARKDSPALGWTSHEALFVERASKYGLCVIPFDHATNISFLAGIEQSAEYTQKNTPEAIKANPDQHYVAIVLSDGDNVQWVSNSFLHQTSHFAQRLQTNTAFKMSYTLPPMLPRFAGTALRSIYEAADQNDHFVAGVSGAGYMFPSQFPRSSLNNFAYLSSHLMGAADMNIVCILDDIQGSRTRWINRQFGPALKYYAAQENIRGGLLQIGDKYAGLGGKIIWSDGKPFISAGKSFWFSNEENTYPDDAWIQSFAEELNALPADITSEKGYTYLNIHPWSIRFEDLNQLVSLLDDHIELVTAEELIMLVAEHVKPS